MNREEIEEEASERHFRASSRARLTSWAYENAIKALLTVAIGAWGVAFALWARNVDEAKAAYVEGQKHMGEALAGVANSQAQNAIVQQELREKWLLVKDRQDRVILVLDDLEKRVRTLETHGIRQQ